MINHRALNLIDRSLRATPTSEGGRRTVPLSLCSRVCYLGNARW
jgi:hypothetical protein